MAYKLPWIQWIYEGHMQRLKTYPGIATAQLRRACHFPLPLEALHSFVGLVSNWPGSNLQIRESFTIEVYF